MRQIGHDECAGDQKQTSRQEPQHNGAWPDMRGDTDPASADDGGDVEKHQVAQAKLPAKRWFGSGHRARLRRG